MANCECHNQMVHDLGPVGSSSKILMTGLLGFVQDFFLRLLTCPNKTSGDIDII